MRQYFDCTILKWDSQKYGSTYILPRPPNLNIMEPKAYLKSHHFFMYFSYNNFWRYFLRSLNIKIQLCHPNEERKLRDLSCVLKSMQKTKKPQIFSKSAKNIHGLKLTLVPLCQMPKEERAENFETWAMYTHHTCWHICMNYLRRMYVVSFHKSFLSTHIYV